MATEFQKLRDRMSPETQARAAQRTTELLRDMDRWCSCLEWRTLDGARCDVCGKPIAKGTADGH